LDNIIFLPDGKHFIYVGEDDGYNHIYLYSMNGIKVRQLTKGQWDVTSFEGYDDKNKLVYYTSAQDSPLRRHVYSVSIDGKKTQKLTSAEGTHSPQFSSGYKYFIDIFSNTTTPTSYTVYDSKGKQVRVIEDNRDLKSKLAGYDISPKEFFQFETKDGIKLNGWMVKPLNFDSSKKYPLLMVQYSGPNSQQVLDRWGIDWEQILAAKGYVVACVDPRGTGARGEEFRKCTYLKLGKYESDDQIEAARYFGDLSFVDASRIGIWGWSYGGFMSSLCLSKSNLFKVGIAVAPVTNWRFYDSVYTERYMRTPNENPSGYDDNSPITHASKLRGRLFLIHGSADDNVHYQNQMEYADKLLISGKQFDMFTYPNRNHSIYGGPVRHHLYTMMIDYLQKNL
jgi:dipeptidyl-peptidase-4